MKERVTWVNNTKIHRRRDEDRTDSAFLKER